jgi:hypothetical protein
MDDLPARWAPPDVTTRRPGPGIGPHLYVIGEREEPAGPVKIGITRGRASRTGRANLNAGNWRTLEVLWRHPVPQPELRWKEWMIHRHLQPWHVRGEWFDIRHLLDAPDGWGQFLDQAYDGSVEGCAAWSLDRDGHRLVLMRRITIGMPRQFEAICGCGEVTVGEPSEALETVQVLFATTHLGYPARDPVVRQLRSRRRPEPDDPVRI